MPNKASIKIGFVCYKYPLYEEGSYIQEFIDSLCSVSKEVVLLSIPFPNTNFRHPDNLKIHWIGLQKFPYFNSLLFEMAVLFKGYKAFKNVDLINVVSARGSLSAWFLGRVLKKPVVLTIEIINDYQGTVTDKISHIFQRIIYSMKYSMIICWSNYYKQTYLDKWKIKSAVKIIPSGINTSRYHPEIDGNEIRKKYSSKSLLIVFAKPMYEYNRKMAEFLLRVMKVLEKEIDIRLLVGQGEQKEALVQYVDKIELTKKVSFMPFVPITEIPKYLAASDIIVLPFTYAATTSRSLLEALSMGKPVVTTRSGEISDIVKDGKEALLCERKEKDVAFAIKRLFQNQKLMLQLGRNARKLICENYSVNTIAKQTIELYLNIIKDAKKQ